MPKYGFSLALIFSFYTPWKCEKTRGFLTFSGVIEQEYIWVRENLYSVKFYVVQKHAHGGVLKNIYSEKFPKIRRRRPAPQSHCLQVVEQGFTRFSLYMKYMNLLVISEFSIYLLYRINLFDATGHWSCHGHIC